MGVSYGLLETVDEKGRNGVSKQEAYTFLNYIHNVLLIYSYPGLHGSSPSS